MRALRLVLLLVVLAATPASAGVWPCSPDAGPRQPITRLFSIHEDNYLVTGIPADAQRSRNQVKFQISFKFDLLPNEGRCGLFFAYTQRSLWNAYAASSPFEDTNYNPQLFFVFGTKDIGSLQSLPDEGRIGFRWARLGIEHESNGRGGTASRSWNRIFASTRLLGRWGQRDFLYLVLQPKVWWPFASSDNPDIVDYVGYGELDTEVGWHAFDRSGRWQDVSLGLLVRAGTVNWRGTVEVTARYRPPWRWSSLSLYAQGFFGYEETLLHYDSRSRGLRIGLALDDRFSWKTGEPGTVPAPVP